MKPKKKILLLVKDENELGMLRFAVANHGYRVSTAMSSSEALGMISWHSHDLLICKCPMEGLPQLLGQARLKDDDLKTIVILADGDALLDCHADLFMHRPSLLDIMERAKVFVQRKRGPKKGTKYLVGVMA